MQTSSTASTPLSSKDAGFSNLYLMRRDPIGFFGKLVKEQGDACSFYIGENPFFLLNHPDLIKEVLVTRDRNFTKWFAVDRLKEVLGQGLFVSEGAYHARQRKLSQPAFHRTRIAAYADAMVKVAERVRERWEADKALDVSSEMNWLAMVIVADTLFGADVESEAVEIQRALSEVLKMLEKSTLPPGEVEEFNQARERLDAAVLRIIQDRRAQGDIDTGDLLSMLLAARDEDGSQMSDIELRDEAMTIFLAGHETTANALNWTWYLLSQHPEIEKEFHRTIDETLGDRLPVLADVQLLKYVEMVFAEAMRLYPPVWVVGRQAIGDCEIGGTKIPAGAVVLLSQFIMQRDARYFPEPEKFDPQRWTKEAEQSRPKYSYFPFSSGSRQCLGEPFAWLEAVMALAVIGQKWQLKLAPGHKVEIQPQITLRSRYAMRMVPVAR